ncbi:MAG: peptidyl-prolyl cis-trans isomerase [Planctomycetes bacterium]|nr:peptidyl-prolyl cis-trans isomerase [Planctomycetota bacterium]
MSKETSYRWPRVLVVCCFLVLLSAGGCGENGSVLTEAELDRIAITEKIQLVEEAGGLVLIVGGETITSDEIIEASADPYAKDMSVAELLRPIAQGSDLEQFKEQARRSLKEVVMGSISGVLLYQHAKREIGSNADEAVDKMAEKELRKFVLKYGGDQAKADEALKEMGMDRESYKERHKRFIITQSYLASRLPYKKPVTYGELVEYYEKNKDELFFKPARLKFRLIDIEIAKVEITDPNQNRLEESGKLGEKLMRQIRAGEDFGKLAEQYSHGHWGMFGGLWPALQPDSLVEPYDILAEKTELIKTGETAGPIETVGHIFIVKLEERQLEGYEPLEKVQGQVNNRILADRQNEAIIRLNERLLRQAAIGETDEFVDFCLEKIYRMSNDQEETAVETK